MLNKHGLKMRKLRTAAKETEKAELEKSCGSMPEFRKASGK